MAMRELTPRERDYLDECWGDAHVVEVVLDGLRRDALRPPAAPRPAAPLLLLGPGGTYRRGVPLRGPDGTWHD